MGSWIPNRNIYIYNNIFYNPAGSGTHYVQFVANGPVIPPAYTENIPSPSLTDDNVFVAGNLVWNFPQEYSGMMGSSDGSTPGCQISSTCDTIGIIAENTMNAFEPQFADTATGNFHPLAGGNIQSATTYAIPSFVWTDAPTTPVVPAGNVTNNISVDRDGLERQAISLPGAYNTTSTPVSDHEITDVFYASVFPNPMSGSAVITYKLNESSSVKIDLLDVFGRLINTIENKFHPAGTHNIILEANECNISMNEGVYFCRITINDQTESIIKIVLLN